LNNYFIHGVSVYAPDMPARLPPVLLLRRLAQQSFFAVVFGIRAVAVAVVWLAVLPWITVWTWRMYFTMGDSTYVSASYLFSLLLTPNFEVLGG
jgi:E3 ubiquitin-protein ligase DOA10